jgi:hypothetical protein|tara:strand:+ start:116 stop:367 length:252 start_codon:yes stop_codon:yes gene_type:complete
MYNYIPKALYDSLLMQARANVLTAKATLQIYFEKSVGIGEHPQHTEEMGRLLDKMAQAEDRKSVLERHFQDTYGDMKNESKKR